MKSITPSSSRLGGLCGDLAAGLRQQMVYWGRDVLHPDGNLLLLQGFAKSPSAGLKGTSCYGLDWQDGRIELHGACAGWYAPDGGEGFLFVRPHGKCHIWKGGAAPVPGEWPADLLENGDHARLLERARPFLDWWLHSEQWIADHAGGSYRSQCHRHLKRLPKGELWLPPGTAMKWVALLREKRSATPRAKRFHD